MSYLNGRVHVVGIGGAGMSGIARVLLARGIEVSGSDAKDSRRLQALKPLGGRVFVGHDADNLLISGTKPSCVVISTAIGQDNTEVVKATELGIPVVSRAIALAELLENTTAISVAGTHGKTTTTSMVTVILQNAGKDPSFVIGSEMNESGSNAHQGSGELFVVEADESDGTFLVLPTTLGIVTNVEADHLNYWGRYEAIEQAFVDFIVGTGSRNGCAVVCGDDEGAKVVTKRARELGANVITYGQGKENDAVLTLLPSGSVGSEFTISYQGQTHGPIKLLVPGVHNALNATAAFIAALTQGCTSQQCVDGLQTFTGTHRRFEFRGEVSGVRVFDDYAHHPTEIDAVLRAARTVVGAGRVLAAFQAHHYYLSLIHI